MDLTEWFVRYVKHKDLIAKKLKSCVIDGGKISFVFEDRTMIGYAQEKLAPVDKGKVTIATPQTRENVRVLESRWNDFVKNEELIVIFVNPARNEKWIVKPALHQKICGGSQGIRTLADGVPYV